MLYPTISTPSMAIKVYATNEDFVFLRIVEDGVPRKAKLRWPDLIEAARSDAPTWRLYDRIALAALVAESDRLARVFAVLVEYGQVITGYRSGWTCLDTYAIDVTTYEIEPEPDGHVDQEARKRILAKRATGLKMMPCVAKRHAVLAEGGGFEVRLGTPVSYDDARAAFPTWVTWPGVMA